MSCLPPIASLDNAPVGAHPYDGGVRFRIFSRHAARLWLLLFDRAEADAPDREIPLDPAACRRDGMWTIDVAGARPGQLYAYRAEGPAEEGFDASHWLLDPAALAVSSHPRWGAVPDGLSRGLWPARGRLFPKGVVVRDAYDWGDDRPPRTPLRDTVIYEAHLRGFTAHPSSGVAHPGTCRGFIQKIPYLKDLGVTAVELLPVQEFNELEFFQENYGRAHLLNYWGYSTVGFFAPMSRYAAAADPAAARDEFRDLVRALHRHGIELILDVVFNHTAEGGDRGPTLHFKGLDRRAYYLLDERGHYLNFSGCGNTVNANNPASQDFIVACLRHWVEAFHVDGFRFDLAAALTRGPDGHPVERPPLIERIAADPVLGEVKRIAEAWDAVGLYQVGSFPGHEWSEWNGRYRDDVRRFWRGEHHLLGPLATRLCGSSDLYQRHRDGSPLKSINYIACHDGFTLADLVSYDRKHNHANGEHNHDGERHNHSRNHGIEGPTDDPAVNALRDRQVRNILATLFLSQGVPMIGMGDEAGRTQHGNNNAYCQDNDISWFDWNRADVHRPLHDFTRRLIAFRRSRAALRRSRFFDGGGQTPDIRWFGPDGGTPDWNHGRALAFRISGSRDHTGAGADEPDLLVFLNGSPHPCTFRLPLEIGPNWGIDWTTQDAEPVLSQGDALTLHAERLSVSVFSNMLVKNDLLDLNGDGRGPSNDSKNRGET